MMYLFLSFTCIITITTASIDITQFACTQDSDCTELNTIINKVAADDPTYGSMIASNPDLLRSVCSTKMGFCSVACDGTAGSIGICGLLSDTISGLDCDATSLICENDLTCVPANNGDDCTLTGLTKCAPTKNVCIPEQSAECDVANDASDGSNTACDTTTYPGFGKCTSTSIMGVALDICGPESCCPEGICADSHCITANTVCQESSGSCSYCASDEQCDPFGLGIICDMDNGKCSTLSPVPLPTNPPTENPIVVTSKPECNDDPCDDGARDDCVLLPPSDIDGKCHVKVDFDIDLCILNKAFKRNKIISDLRTAAVDIGGDGASICSGGEWSIKAYKCWKKDGALFDFDTPPSDGGCPTDVVAQCKNQNNGKAANIVGSAAIYCSCSDDDALNDIKDKIISNVVEAKTNFATGCLAASVVDDTLCATGFGAVEANTLSVSLVDKDGTIVEKIDITGGVKKMYYYIAIVVGMVGVMFL